MDLHYALGHGTRSQIVHLVRVHGGWHSGLTGSSVCGARTLVILSSQWGQADLRADQRMCKKCVKYVDQNDPTPRVTV